MAAVKGGRVLKSEEKFNELESQAEEIEAEMDDLFKQTEDTIERLKKLNKGVLTDLANRKVRREDNRLDMTGPVPNPKHMVEQIKDFSRGFKYEYS